MRNSEIARKTTISISQYLNISLERKILHNLLLLNLLLLPFCQSLFLWFGYLFKRFPGYAVIGIRFDEDGLGFGRAGVFAGAATDADFFINRGDHKGSGVWHHNDRLGGAMFGTGGAGGVLCADDAAVPAEPGIADLQGLFFLHGDRLYGAAGTHLGALHALMVAIGCPEVHLRLEEPCEPVFEKGGLKDMGGTGADTKMAGGAFLCEMGQAYRTRGCYRVIAHALCAFLFGKDLL